MKVFLGSIILLAFAFITPKAFASEYALTNNGTSTDFNDGNNYTSTSGTGVVPGAGDILYIFPGFTTAADATLPQIDVTAGGATTITLTSSSNHTLLGLLVSSNFESTSYSGVLNLSFTGGSTLSVGTAEILGGVTVNYSGNLAFTSEGVSGGEPSLTVGTTTSELDFGQTTGAGTLNLSNGTLNLDPAGTESSFIVGSGAKGTVNQNGGSTVNSGTFLTIGADSGAGSYNVTSGAALNLGAAGEDNGYVLAIGDGAGSVGTLTINGGFFNAVNPDTTIDVGNAGTGTIVQTSSNVILSGDINIGAGGTGFYTLQSGSLSIISTPGTGEGAVFTIGGVSMDSVGQFTQSGGSLTTDGSSTFTVGGTLGSTSGLYAVSGGTATFNDGLIISNTGTVSQTGGTVTITNGTALDLSSVGGVYNLNGGTLQVGPNGLAGVADEGKLNLGGGNLTTTAGTVTDALDGSLSGASTINAAGTLIFSGTLSGNGSLTVAAGTVQASPANLPSISGVALRSGTTLNLTTSGANTDIFTGTISGAGNLETGNTGVDNNGGAIAAPAGYQLILLKAANLPNGTTTIAAGTGLQLPGGTLNTVTGGAGSSLTVGSAGGGTLTALGTVTVPNVQVNSGSGLRVGNVVGSIVNNGSLDTLAAESTLTVSGSLSQPQQATVAQEGTLIVRTNGVTSDAYDVGSANLFGSVKVVGVGSNTYNIVTTSAPGQLTTGTLNSHTADGLASTPNTVLFTSTLSEEGNQILQLTTVQKDVTPFAGTPNQRAVGQAIDTQIQLPPASFVPLLLGLDSITDAGSIPDALNQLTPQSFLYMRDIAFENTTFLAQRVDGFLTNLRTGYAGLDTSGLSILGPGFDSKLGQSLGSLLAYNGEAPAPNGVNYYPDDNDTSSSSAPLMVEPSPAGPATMSDSVDPRMAPTVAPPPSTSVLDGTGVGFNQFVSGDLILGELNQDDSGSSQPKANYVAGNATAGVSFRMNSNLAAGVLFDYNHTDALTSVQGSHVRVDSYSPGLFATFFEHGFYANGLFTFGYNNYSDDRKISIGTFDESATSKPSGEQYAPNIDVGYDFHPDRHWVVGPTAGLGYTHLDVDSFHESGAGAADLAVGSQSADSLRGRLGGRVVYLVHSGSILFQPNLSLSFQHEFLNDPFHLDSQLNIPGTPSFQTQGSNSGRNTGLLTFGLTATLDNSMNLYLNYLAELGGDDYLIQSVEGGVKASF